MQSSRHVVCTCWAAHAGRKSSGPAQPLEIKNPGLLRLQEEEAARRRVAAEMARRSMVSAASTASGLPRQSGLPPQGARLSQLSEVPTLPGTETTSFSTSMDNDGPRAGLTATTLQLAEQGQQPDDGRSGNGVVDAAGTRLMRGRMWGSGGQEPALTPSSRELAVDVELHDVVLQPGAGMRPQ